MTVRRNAFGRQVDSFEGDVRMPGVDDRPVHAVFIRAPWVEGRGGVEVLARVEGGPAAGRIVAVRQGTLLATSFHPELTGDLRVHELFDWSIGAGTSEDTAHVRPLQVGDHQAQEGGHRRPARQALRQADQEHRGGGAHRWRRLGGNPTLYDAIQKAKKTSVPNDNIDRAVKRGSGVEAGGADWQTIMYEGYGPERRRGADRVPHRQPQPRRVRGARTAMTRNGGSMADPGSVSYLFTRKGVVIVPKSDGLTEDDVLAAVLDAGAEEVNDLGEAFEVVSRGDRPGRGAHRAAGRRHRLRLGRRVVPAQRSACRWTRTAPARCSG